MQSLSQQQIKIQELKLLQVPGYSLRDFSNANQKQIFNPITNFKQINELKKITPKHIKSLNISPNANLHAFSWILLQTIFKKCLADDVLQILKSTILSNYLDTVKILNLKRLQVSRLSPMQIKKFLVEFIFELTYSNQQNKVETKINKYPIILDLMATLFRKLLVTYDILKAEDYSTPIYSLEGFRLLIDYFDLNCKNQGNVFLFYQEKLFLYVKSEKDVIIGRYDERKHERRVKTESMCPRPVALERINKQEQQSLNNIHLAESLILEADADTPSFYYEEQRTSFKSSRVSETSNSSNLFDSERNHLELVHSLKTNDLKKSMKQSPAGNFGGAQPTNNRRILEYQLKQSMERIIGFDKIIDTPPTNDYSLGLSDQAFNFISAEKQIPKKNIKSLDQTSIMRKSISLEGVDNEQNSQNQEEVEEEDNNIFTLAEERLRINTSIYDINIKCDLEQNAGGKRCFNVKAVTNGLSGEIYTNTPTLQYLPTCPTCMQTAPNIVLNRFKNVPCYGNQKSPLSFSKKPLKKTYGSLNRSSYRQLH